MGRQKRESTMITKTFADRLSDLVEEKKSTGLSHNEICEQAGVGSGAMSDWLSDNKTANIDSLCKLATYFGVSADYLLGISELKTYKVHPRAACELTGLSESAFKTVWALSSYRNTDPKNLLKNTLNDFLSNQKFVSLMMELKTCMVESEHIGSELSSLSYLEESGAPSDPIELLNYVKEKWGYKWDSGEHYYGIGTGFEIVELEEKRGYSFFLCQNIFMEIIKELSESKIREAK